MKNEISLSFKKGLDLNLEGGITDTNREKIMVNRVALTPDDFTGFMPKPEVKEGDSVVKGQAVLRDKNTNSIKLTSPVSGTVKAIVRGDRRKIMRVEIEVDKDSATAKEFEIDGNSADSIKEALMESGLWAMMRQRPYDIVPCANQRPRDIFVTAFDSAPLAPTLALSANGKEKETAAGVEALKKLTSGKVYISVRETENIAIPTGATAVRIKGPHPAGNAGVQAANIAPVNKGETIWTLDIVTLARIGSLMLTGKVDWATTIAVTGSEVKTPKYVDTVAGAEIAPLIAGNVKEDGVNHRIISGNVFTGITTDKDGYLHYPYRQITIIPEGNDKDEFMGWASVSAKKMSTNRSFPGHFLTKKLFAPDARLHGGRRAMIMSGEYDKVLPMDILPEYLLKAIISRDIEKMEQLGIYEIAPEDVALCEYADPSKIEIQKIVREGLDYLHKELEDA